MRFPIKPPFPTNKPGKGPQAPGQKTLSVLQDVAGDTGRTPVANPGPATAGMPGTKSRKPRQGA